MVPLTLTPSLFGVPLGTVGHCAGRSRSERRGRRCVRAKRQHLLTLGDTRIVLPGITSTVTNA
ncbi:hypothetical protein HMPREF1979_01388 [Actinomyces johnsonii F0542]|uniref:Uncharacterized protein n=2 Tax=Actinomyces johnsonii TaxID=544581 RepID=U1S0S3_9ACTO|nr:hypothetical protein HMPREF1549_01915 [Actinomyces johnsonii F0510]ERH24272.1 hypothetical protein HMPREF1979_01388 [Actinomyces johnsonii F0542]